MRKTFFLTVVLAVGVSMITACGTSGSFTIHHSSTEEVITQGSVVDLIVTPPNSDGTSVAIQLRGHVAAQLLGAGLFKSIANPGGDADYKITVVLTEIDDVSGTSRVLWGLLAGSNIIEGVVKILNNKSGQMVRSFSFHAESASHPNSGKADMSDAIAKAAEEIIKGLEQ